MKAREQDPPTLWADLARAVDTSNAERLAALCNANREMILEAFPQWQFVPEAIRNDAEAIEHYGQTLIAVAEFFDRELDIPILLQRISADTEEDSLSKWNATLLEIDALKDQTLYQEALERMHVLKEAANEIGGPNRPRIFALTYGRHSELYFRLGALESARKYGELALGASLEARDREGVTSYVRNLHEIAKEQDDYGEMEKWAAIGVRSTSDMGLRAAAAQWQCDLAAAQELQSRWDEAAATLRDGIGDARSALRDDPMTFSTLLNNAAELFRRHREFDEARPLFEEAIRLRGEAGIRDVTLAQILHNLAFLHQELPDPAPARGLLEESLAISRSLLPPDAPLITQTLGNLGSYYQMVGDYEAARTCYSETVKLRGTDGANRDVDSGVTLTNWADLEMDLGNDPIAKSLIDRCEETASEETDTAAHVRQMNRVASLYARLGKYDAAERLMHRVLRVVEQIENGKEGANYARALAELANVVARHGREPKAEPMFKDALDRMRRLDGLMVDDLSTVLNNFGLFYYETGENDKAAELLSEALDRRRETLPAENSRLIDTVNNLGLVYITQGRFSAAESLLREVLDIRRKILIPDHPNIAQSLFNLGMLYAEAGRVDEALPLLEEQFRLEERLLSNLFSVASEDERLAYAAKLRENLDVLMMKMIAWAERPDAVRIAFEAVLRRKGIVADAVARDRFTARATVDDAARDVLSELNGVRERLARAVLDATSGDTTSPDLDALSRRRELLESKLARVLSESSASASSQVDCETVSSALAKGTAHLEFLRFRLVAAGLSKEQEQAAYAVFVLPDGGSAHLRLLFLGLAEQMESSLELFRGAITKNADVFVRRGLSPDRVDMAATETSVGLNLSSVLIERIQPALGDRRRIFISPDGDLNRLPFEVLPLSNGRRFGDDFEISYLSSGRDHLRITSTTTRASGPALVVADPDFDLPSTTAVSVSTAETASSTLRFAPLPDTRTEGEWVASRLGVPCWAGADAVEALVKRTRSPRVLHLATHGFFLSRPPSRIESSTTGLASRSPEVSSDPSVTTTTTVNPLLCSGLALAGANRWLAGGSPPVEAEDGLLTAEDVCAIDLTGTELVVPSACETGLGEYREGEGVFGLRRAFELAGAGSLVMSLWRVPSGPTCALMKEFYRQLSGGRRRSQALSEAQRVIRRRYPDTVCWGAFVLSGDPSPMA